MAYQPSRVLPIRHRLLISFAVTTALALALATAGLLAFTAWDTRQSVATELSAVATVIGANSTAALAFGDKAAAAETLESLRAVPQITSGIIYDANGREFARYHSAETDHFRAPLLDLWETIWPGDRHRVAATTAISLDGQALGTVTLEATLAFRIIELRKSSWTAIAAIATSLSLALLIAWRLQRAITNPIRDLTGIMSDISENHDYTVRATAERGDELGLLANGINHMLERVQERDAQLKQHRDELEAEVERRTATLKETNDRLASELEERERAQTELRLAHEELERHNREIAILTDMNDRLQVCHTIAETWPVVSYYAARLFPGSNGGLYLFNASRTLVEAAVCWGPLPPPDSAFKQADCWALRQGKTHTVWDKDHGLLCEHCKTGLEGPYLCVPMVAYGDVMGVLHVRLPSTATEVTALLQQLVLKVAEDLALALANLKLREELQAQSVRDPLTSLYNRRFMQESLERELARIRRAKGSLGVLMLDVDHFKKFNDTHGHKAGDLALVEVARLLQESIRDGDIACRYGGEEFIVILPGMSGEAVLARAETIRRGAHSIRIQHRGQTLEGLSVSIGMAVAPEDGDSADNLQHAADTALYQAKRAGRDRVVSARGGAPKPQDA